MNGSIVSRRSRIDDVFSGPVVFALLMLAAFVLSGCQCKRLPAIPTSDSTPPAITWFSVSDGERVAAADTTWEVTEDTVLEIAAHASDSDGGLKLVHITGDIVITCEGGTSAPPISFNKSEVASGGAVPTCLKTEMSVVLKTSLEECSATEAHGSFEAIAENSFGVRASSGKFSFTWRRP